MMTFIRGVPGQEKMEDDGERGQIEMLPLDYCSVMLVAFFYGNIKTPDDLRMFGGNQPNLHK